MTRASHGEWAPASDRPDPLALLEAQETTRVPELVPIRHGRMAASPFAFYRGAANVLAADLAAVPHSGLRVQLCGDAHLANFGGFASTGAQPGVRPQRLRRDPSGAVRVGRQAPGGQPGDRRPQPGLRSRGANRDRQRFGALLPRGDSRLRQDAEPRRLVRPPGRRRHPGPVGWRPRPQSRSRASSEPSARPPSKDRLAGRRQADPPRRRRAAVRQRPAAPRPGRGAASRRTTYASSKAPSTRR